MIDPVYRFKVRRFRLRDPGAPIKGPTDVARFAIRKIGSEDREHFISMFVGAQNQLLGYELIAVGSLASVDAHPREVFRGAILAGAAAVVLAHNHPSENTRPSADDIALTRRMCAAGDLLGIPVFDHVIVTARDWYSIADSVDGISNL